SRSQQIFVLAIAVAAVTSMPRVVAKGSQGNAHLRHARPLYGHNPIQNGAEADDDDDTAVAPTLNALCQAYLGQPSPFANPAPNVDQIVADAVVPPGSPPSSQAGCSTAQNETTIVVNPHNPNNVVAGANDYRRVNDREGRVDSSGLAYASLDGGA